jgi:putative ABC transport system ATP-binding protein
MNVPFVIKANLLSKYFHRGKSNEICAFSEVSFSLKKGECLLLHGYSGTGKSTLLNILACLCKPTSGEYICLDEPVSRYSELFAGEFRRKHIGIIFQNFRLLKDLSVAENILLPLVPSFQTLSMRESEKTVLYAAEKADIAHKLSQNAGTLSGGEMQRVAFARAIVNNPALIIADEPTSNLDRKNAVRFLEKMAEFKEEGKTIIISSHDDLVKNSTLIDQVYEMRHG